ncbi:hypothetical protein BGZ72_001958, partial [Mortierella alpina]
MNPCTPISQALVLPEVLYCIGSSLDNKQALICSQVCSTWYLNFAPIVWENVHIGRPKSNVSDKYVYQRKLEPRMRSIDLKSEGCNPREQLGFIREKASWLRSLTIHKHVSPQQFTLGKECTQLRAISIEGPIPFDNDYTRDYWNSCKALIKQNKSRLTSLTVEVMQFDIWYKPDLGVPRWDPFLSCAGHTNLTELKLVFCNIRGRHLKPFWKICERLEKLTLDNVSLDISRLPTHDQIQHNSKVTRAARAKAATKKSATPPPLPPTRFPLLRELTLTEALNSGPERYLDHIIADCPRLESLNWTLEHAMTIYAEPFINYILAGTWPLLDKIRLNVFFFSFTEVHLAALLHHIRKPLKILSLINEYLPMYEDQTFNIMKERHFSTLEEIHLSSLGNDCWVQDLLASCPSLKIIRAFRLDAAAVMKDKRPWACLGLKVLRISLEITRGSSEDSRAFFSQLARLKQLRSLTLHSAQRGADTVNKVPLPLWLEMGLDILAEQTKLEVINLCKDQNVDKNDILWMVKHLTSLRKISGGSLSDKKAERRAFKDRHLGEYELTK